MPLLPLLFEYCASKYVNWLQNSLLCGVISTTPAFEQGNVGQLCIRQINYIRQEIKVKWAGLIFLWNFLPHLMEYLRARTLVLCLCYTLNLVYLQIKCTNVEMLFDCTGLPGRTMHLSYKYYGLFIRMYLTSRPFESWNAPSIQVILSLFFFH